MLSKMNKFHNTSLFQLVKRQGSSAVLPGFDANIRPYEDIPSPKGWPIIGNLDLMMKKSNVENLFEFHNSLRQQFGDIYKLKMPGKGTDIVSIYDPDDGRTLLSADGAMPISPVFESFNLFRTGSLKSKFTTPGLASQNQEWLDFRKAVQQDLMRPRSALYYVTDLDNLLGEVMEKLEGMKDSEGVVSTGLQSVLKEYTLEAIAVMFLGSKLDVLRGSHISKKLIENVDNLISISFFTTFLPPNILKMTGLFQKAERYTETIFDLCEAEVNKTKRRMETDESLRETVLGKMIVRNGADSPIPVIMAIDALGAGIDTTGITAIFLLHQLSTHPEKQETLYQEILNNVGSTGTLTVESVENMKYLKACLTESQRLRPILLGTVRRTREDLVMKGFRIPAGTMIIRHSTNDEKHYRMPHQFLPERWIRDNPEYSKPDPFTNLSFGHGPRSCIGQRFARLELYILAAKLVQRYRLEYVGAPLVTNTKSTFQAPTGEVQIKFIPRV